MNRLFRARTWYVLTGILLALYASVSLLGGRSVGVTVFGNLVQQALLVLAVVFLVPPIFSTRGRERAFWLLLTLGALLWCLSQLEWVIHEVFLRTEVPDVSWGDILLFFHPVPWIAALLLWPAPARADDEEKQYTLDFSILLLWAIYLYVFLILAWQLPSAQHLANAGKSYTLLFLAQNLTVLALAGGLFARARGAWRHMFRNLTLAGAAYILCSWMIHYQVFGYEYYTGCLYDLPLVFSICMTGSVGLLAREEASDFEHDATAVPSSGRWAAVLAALALVSMPAMALWSAFFSDAPRTVSAFRIGVTLIALPFVALLFLLKQRLLNQRLQRMLDEAEESLHRQQGLQDRLVESGKMAALGQLVAGIAHEINNPLTAILGYSEILESAPGPPEKAQDLGRKIAMQARRTKRHVESMLSFARRSPSHKSVFDVTAMLRSLLTVHKGDIAGRTVTIEEHLAEALPGVFGDSNQLLQVFVHLMNNGIEAMQEAGGGTLEVSTAQENGEILVTFSDSGPGISEPEKVFDPFYTTKAPGKGAGLGLSTCYGIVVEHGGTIACENRTGGGASFLIRLPAAKVNLPR